MSAITRIHNVADARRVARRTLPRPLFDYVDGGAEDEATMRRNVAAFRGIAFRPRVGATPAQPDLSTTVLGSPVALPVLLAPCGLAQLLHVDGALGAARAAHEAGTLFALSASAGVPPEDLAGEPGPRWFQLYAPDRDSASALVDRAASSGFGGLVVTVDTPVLGKRERDLRNGVQVRMGRLDTRAAIRMAPQLAARPRWCWSMLPRAAATMAGTPAPGDEPERFPSRARLTDLLRPPGGAARAAARGRPTDAIPPVASPFTWEDIAWIRGRWSGRLIVKGVLSAPDALRAADEGADAVIVSNHGGRQLEGAPASIAVLPEIADAASGRLEVLLDGGIRRGGDVAKALAVGARAVLVGRPYLYALAAAGQPGVARVLAILREELARTLMLLGCPSAAALDRTWAGPEAAPGSATGAGRG